MGASLNHSRGSAEDGVTECAENKPMKKLIAWLVSPLSRKLALGTLAAVGLLWLVIRFCGLETSPPGFFLDEATAAVHAMCLSERGHDAYGVAWPIYSRGAIPEGGQHPITLLAFDVLWLKIFGKSRAAFRAASGFWFLVTALGLLVLARDLVALMPSKSADQPRSSARRAFPWMVLLSALLSPWSFQFSRIAWECPLGPAFMVLALVGVVRSHRGGKLALVWAAFAGFCAAASMTSYAPFRLVMPLLLTAAVAILLALTATWRARLHFFVRMLVAALAAVAFFAPTLRMLLSGQITQRMNTVAIWNPAWMSDHIGKMGRTAFLVTTFFDNLLAHLQPSFLFVRGDANWRHSPQISGHLSPVDTLALALVCGTVAHLLWGLIRGRSPLPKVTDGFLSDSSRWLMAIALCAILGGFFAVVPSALTWEGVPTALRSIGAWPFVALFSGAVLAMAWSKLPGVPALLAVVALVYTLLFLPAYFHAYDVDRAERFWFMRDLPDAIARERREQHPRSLGQIISSSLGYSYNYDEVSRYYLMSVAHMRCNQAVIGLKSYWNKAYRQ